MKTINSMAALEEFGRIRLFHSFFMRDFLHSEISSFYGVPNIPDDPALAIEAGRQLCETLLEPLQATFGCIGIRSAYRSCTINELGNRKGLNCASNEKNYARHIWDRRDSHNRMGAMACIVIPSLLDRFAQGESWQALAWWIHDHLPYSSLYFFPKLTAFNIGWNETPERRIDSYIPPKGCLTKPGADNHAGCHAIWYPGYPSLASEAFV